MQRWICLEEDFDPEDDTNNYKNPKIFTPEDHIEGLLTLRTFESTAEILGKAHIRAVISESEKLCVSIDETVFVFGDAKCSSLLFSINVGSQVDCCCFVDKTNNLLIGTRNGDVRCVNLQGRILFKRSISTEICSEDLTFVKIFGTGARQGRGTYSALIVGRCGSINRISWREITNLNSRVDVSIHSLKDGEGSSKYSDAVMPSQSTIALVGQDFSLWCQTVVDSCSFSSFGLNPCVKAQMWKERFLVCLTIEGELVLLCTQTLLCCAKWQKFKIQDFIIMKEENDAHKEKVVVLRVCNDSEKSIAILSLPDLKVIYEVEVSQSSWLILASPTVLCIEGFTSSDCVEKLKIIILSHCHPRQRLQFYLKEHKFDEAEALAHQFDLDIEIVFKEKVLFSVTTLSSLYDPLLFNDLICTLDKISDIQFVTAFCAEQCTYQIDDMKSLLQYGLKKIQHLKGSVSPDIQKIQLELYSKLRTLETITLLKEDISCNVMKWKNMLYLDWLKVFFTKLSDGKMREAKIIWIRHLQDGQIPKEEEIKQLFVSLSPCLKQSEILDWLQIIIPYILQYAPDVMENLVKWAVERAKLMQNSEELWPNSTINFIQKINVLITEIVKTREGRSFHYFGNHKEFLLSFLFSLQELMLLKEDYGIKISLEEFLQENKFDVASSILRKITHHDVDRLLNGYMKNFIARHHLSMDSVVLHFIKKLLAAVGVHWIHLPVTNWEPVVVTCIPYVQNVQDKIECMLSALKFASIPWSDAVLALAAKGRKLNNSCASEIKRLEKLVEIKLVFKKYHFKIDLLDSSKPSVSLFIIRKIIMKAQSEKLKDALIIAGDSLKLQVEAYMMCLHDYISKKMCDEAQIVLERMDSKTFEMCCRRLFCRIHIETNLPALYNYIDIISSLSSKLVGIPDIVRDLDYIKSLYILNLNFGYKMTFQDFSNIKKRCHLLKLWIKSLVCHISTNSEDGPDLYSLSKNAMYLAQLCFLPCGDGLLEVFEHLPSGTLTRKENQMLEVLTVEIVSFSRDKLCSLMKQILNKMSGTDSYSPTYCRMMTDLILCHRLSINDPWLCILTWINRARDISRISVCDKTENLSAFRLLHVFQDCHGSAWKPEVIQLLQLIFKLKKQFDVSDDVTLKLQHLVEELKDDPVMLIALLNMSRCTLESMSGPSSNLNDKFLKKILEKQLSNMIHSQSCDIHFACGILLSLNATTAENWLCESVNEFRTRFQKLERITKLGMFLSAQNKTDMMKFKHLNAECLWARHFRRYNIVCEKSLVGGKKEIVLKLICEKDIETAETFSRTFEINFLEYLPLCLEQLILSWKPDFEIKENKDGRCVLFVRNYEDGIVDTCLTIAERMEKRDLKHCLQNISEKINYYYYEMYFCINIVRRKILQEESRPQLLLLFLRNYLRSSPMQKEERDAWFLMYPSSHELPTIAEKRLPFWPNDMDRVIRQELTLYTYEKWLDLASILNISEDCIRVIALRHLSNMPELSSQGSPESDWCLDSLDETIIFQIQKCAKGIVNQELSCAALNHVFRFIKCGTAKSQLGKLCYEFTKRWADATKTDESANILKNITQTHLDVSSKNILYKFGLGKSCYVNKISKPEILIRELYNHPDIVKINHCHDIHCPDINSAVNEISEVQTEMKLEKLLLELLEEWLAPANSINDKFDDTITIERDLQTLNVCAQKDMDNFIRASYLLRKKNSNALLVTLLYIIFSDENANGQFKRNALSCIMSTIPIESVCNLCEKSPDGIRHHLQILQFISELSALGYIMSLSQFKHCKKCDLVMELITSGKTSDVLSLAAQIALRYSVFDAEVWELLLKYMVEQTMYEDLQDVLGKLPASTPGIVGAWTYVLFVPFHSCTVPLSDDQSKSCLHSFKLLHKCQVTDRIDLLQMAQLCCQLDSPQWAAKLLHFMNRDQQEVLKKNLLSSISVNKIMLKLQDDYSLYDIEDDYMLSRIRTMLE